MNLPQTKQERDLYPEYKQVVNQVILQDESISYNLKSELKGTIIGKLINKNKGNILAREYFRLAKKVLREKKESVQDKFGELQKEFEQKYQHLRIGCPSIKILPEYKKIRLAKIAANQSGWSTSQYIQNYKIEDEQARIEIAKIATNQNGEGTSEYIQNYEIQDEQARIEIAKIAAAKDGGGTSAYIQNYGIQDEQARIEIAKIVAAKDGGGTSAYIQNYGIQDEQARIEIAKIAAAQDGGGTSEYIQNYKIEDEQARIEIAKIAANQNGEGTSEYIQDYKIQDEQARIEIFRIAFTQSFKILENAGKYKLGLESLELDSINGKFLYNYFNDGVKKGIFLKNEVNTIFSENTSINNLLFLSQIIVSKTEEIDQNLGNKNNSRNLFFQEIGLNPDIFIDKKYSEKSIQDFYTLCIRIYKNLGKAFFEGLNIEESLANDRKLSQLMEFLKITEELSYLVNINQTEEIQTIDILRTIQLIQENIEYNKQNIEETTKNKTQNIIEGLASPLEKGDGKIFLTKENIDAITHNLKHIHLAWFQSVFQINNKRIEKENLEKLEDKWGNLDVLFTLISRFYGNDDWIQEIPVFSRVVEHVLSNTFHKYKYEGYHGDTEDQKQTSEQLKGLSLEEKEQWKHNPHSLKVYASKKDVNLSDSELLKSAQGEYIEQLLKQKHLDEIEKGLSEEIGNLNLASFNSKELEIVKTQKSKEALKGIQGNTRKAKQKQYIKILLTILKTTEDKQVFENVLKNLKGLGESKAIKDDLDSIHSKLKPIERGEESILFTTLFDDPKLLLEVGDLVDAASCQNYKTGGYIQNLLGYVIDANVKGVLGFAIDRKHLGGDNKKYENLKQLIQKGDYELKFDAPKRILKINEIEIELGQAVARRIVKLGNDKKVLLERPYYQNHFARDEVLENIESLTGSYVKSFDGKIVEKGIEFEATRNPGGVYSDASGGIRYGKYSI